MGYTICFICDNCLITIDHWIPIGCSTFLRAIRASSHASGLLICLTSTATVMAKRSATELYEHYYTGLVFSLPIKDVDFMDELLKHDLLPEDVKSKMESLVELNKKSAHFLDNVIKPGLVTGNSRYFVSLLTIMKHNKHDNVKELATKIEKELTIDVKCKIIICIYVFVMLCLITLSQ